MHNLKEEKQLTIIYLLIYLIASTLVFSYGIFKLGIPFGLLIIINSLIVNQNLPNLIIPFIGLMSLPFKKKLNINFTAERASNQSYKILIKWQYVLVSIYIIYNLLIEPNLDELYEVFFFSFWSIVWLYIMA